jgi:phage I-like protein
VTLTIGKLIALNSTPITNGALSGATLPTRLKLLSWGENATLKGPVNVTAYTASTLPGEQQAKGFDRVALDFNHNSFPGHPNFQKDPREVAAYGVPTVIPGDGLWLEDIDWTPAGQKYARNYIDLSPTPTLNNKGEVTFLHSVALCPQGAVEGLSFYSPTNLPPTANMTPISPELQKLITTLFECDEGSTPDQILQAGQTYIKRLLSFDKEPGDVALSVEDPIQAEIGRKLGVTAAMRAKYPLK